MSFKNKQYLSYVITFIAYVLFFSQTESSHPIWATLVLMLSIAWHENGHLLAGARVGMKSKGFFLIPFIGGLALSNGTYKRYRDQAFVVLMGPISGGLLAIVIYGVYLVTHNKFIGEAALWMTFLNLFNLVPISFLDGGQFLETISYSINETFGLIIMSISTIIGVPLLFFISPILAMVVGVFGTLNIIAQIQRWKTRRTSMGRYLEPIPHPMTWKEILISIGAYLLTGVLLLSIIISKPNDFSIFGIFLR